jgi:hypothetical protein
MIKAYGSLRVSGHGGRKSGQDCVEPMYVKTSKNGLFGCTSTVCMKGTVILKIRAVCSTKIDSLTDTPCRN